MRAAARLPARRASGSGDVPVAELVRRARSATELDVHNALCARPRPANARLVDNEQRAGAQAVDDDDERHVAGGEDVDVREVPPVDDVAQTCHHHRDPAQAMCGVSGSGSGSKSDARLRKSVTNHNARKRRCMCGHEQWTSDRSSHIKLAMQAGSSSEGKCGQHACHASCTVLRARRAAAQ